MTILTHALAYLAGFATSAGLLAWGLHRAADAIQRGDW